MEKLTEAAHDHTIGATVAKLTPAGVVGGGILAGVDWPTVVLIMSAVLITIQIGHTLWRWRREYLDSQHDRRKQDRGHKPERRK